jgi:hypothetical protein
VRSSRQAPFRRYGTVLPGPFRVARRAFQWLVTRRVGAAYAWSDLLDLSGNLFR